MAFERELKTVISAEDRASPVVAGFGGQLSKLQKQGASLIKIGAGVAAVGAAIGFSFVKASKSAISFEDAFAGVRKTVDATEEEFEQLTNAFKKLSKETPIAFEEMAKIGEIAGVLGIQGVGNITKFTETISLIGPTTNLTTEVAATAFARLFTIMDVNIDQVDKLGSALVGLGNNFATTEAEISEMALRLSGAGRIIGLSVPDVLGLSAALTSVGVKAQAGGTALSRAFAQMAGAIAAGGLELDLFAQVAGVASVDFAKSFKEKPIEAIITFIKGLKQITEEGGNVFAALDLVGFISIRQKDAFLRLAGAGDLLTRSVALASEEWEKNTALVEEAQKRFKTVASQIQIVKNNFDILAAGIGEQLLPIIRAIAGFLTRMAQRFDGLSVTQKKTITVVGVLASAFLLLFGTGLVLTGTFILLGFAASAMGVAILPIIGIVAAVAAGIIALGVATFFLVRSWETFKTKTIEIWSAIKEFFVEIFASIGQVFVEGGNQIKIIWSSFLETLTEVWQFTWIFIQEFIKNILGLIVGAILLALDLLIPNWSDRLKSILNITKIIFNAIKNFVVVAITGIKDFIITTITALQTIWNTIWSSIQTFFEVVFGGIKEFLEPTLNSIKGTWETVWGGVRDFFINVFDAIAEKVSSVVSFIETQVNRLKSLVETAQRFAATALGAVGGFGTSLIESGRRAIGIDDAIIRPDGQIITTNPDDFLIATRNPSGLGGTIINITGNTIVGGDVDEVARVIGDQLIERLNLNLRIA